MVVAGVEGLSRGVPPFLPGAEMPAPEDRRGVARLVLVEEREGLHVVGRLNPALAVPLLPLTLTRIRISAPAVTIGLLVRSSRSAGQKRTNDLTGVPFFSDP